MTEARAGRFRYWMVKGYLLSVAVLLLLTATLKLFGTPSGWSERLTPDPVISFMTSRDIMAFAMLLEYVIGFYILFGRDQRLKLAAVLALTTAFVGYCIGLYLFGYSTDCRCLGSMAAAFAAETPARYVLYGILLYMGIGSMAGMWMNDWRERNNKCVKSNAASAILVLMSFCTANIGQAQVASNTILPFEVEGILRCTFYHADQSVATNQVYNYKAWHINPNTWKIRTYLTSEQYCEEGCDGTNTYSLFYDPGEDKPAMAANIRSDCYPAEPYPVRVPWFAYLSGAYVSTNKYFPALWAVPDPLEQMFEADIKFIKEPPFLPETARWKISESRVSHAEEIMEGIYFARMPPVVKHGLANLRRTVNHMKENNSTWCYAVESVTNYGGMILPLKYKLSIHTIEKRKDSATNSSKAATFLQGYKTNFSAEFIGLAARIASPSDFNVLPALPLNKRVDVSDGRFRNAKLKVHGIQYSITNQWILDTMDPRLASLAEAKYKQSRKLVFSPMKAAFCAGLVCISLLVLWFSWKVRRPAQRHEKNI